ncbi:MAG: hypothetical protein WA776_18320 [Xanthobacteraceae bacterium]
MMWKMVLTSVFLVAAPIVADAQKQIQITLHWITDAHGCKVWDSSPSAGESVTWSGPCVDGYAQGKGTLAWFVNGKPYGTYEGELKGGHYDGEGTQIWPSGARYDGGWKSDRADGHGTYRNPQGDVCSGKWLSGCFQGLGCNHSVGTPQCPP